MRSTARCCEFQRALSGWLWGGSRGGSGMAQWMSSEGRGGDLLSEWSKEFKNDRLMHVDQELEEFLLNKAAQEGKDSNRLFSTPVTPLPSALQEALTVCEDQLEKLEDAPKKKPSEKPSSVSSKLFDVSHNDFMKDIEADMTFNDFAGAGSTEQLQQGMIQDFLDGFAKAKERASPRVASSFGPLKRQPYKTLDLRHQITSDTDKAFPFGNKQTDQDDHRPLPSKPMPRGGFRINVYRNLTGSVKELLVHLRKEALNTVTAQVKSSNASNAVFVEQLLESLKYADVTVKGDLRPRMNALCLYLMECLERLTANEVALVCIVFGELGYSNSLVYYQLLGKMQKPETLKEMSIEALAGSVLSLGMLQSTDPEFMDSVSKEFMDRLSNRETSMPPGIFGCLLLGCSHSRETERAHKMTSNLLDCMSAEELHHENRPVSWMDIAVGTYTCSQLKMLKPDLLQVMEQKLKSTERQWNMTCTETAVLLVGLEGLSHLVYNKPLNPQWKTIYASLEDHVGSLIEKNEVRLTSIPDLIRNLSFPGLERLERYKALGRLLIDADLEKEPLPLWPLVHRLMSGYANVLYRDPEVLKALNARFRASKMPLLQASTISNLLHAGCRLRGLEESVVNRIVEWVAPKSFFWQKVVRFKDAAKIAYSLAAFEKLTPEIFGECWKRCASIRFDQYDAMLPDEAVDTMYIAQGLFVGYEYVRQKFSASAARKHISLKGHKDLQGIIKKRNQTVSGQETQTQREVAKYLGQMGVDVACPALILEGLYRVEMVLQDAKVVVIKESDWKKTKEEDREEFLMQAFGNEGVRLKKLMKLPMKEQATKPSSVEELQSNVMEWLSVRSTVLNGLKRDKLIALLKTRLASLLAPPEDAVIQLTSEALSKNGITIKAESSRSISSRRKPEIIQDILALEVRNLFGDEIEQLVQSSDDNQEMEMSSDDQESAGLLAADG